jgi:hypothetical protein
MYFMFDRSNYRLFVLNRWCILFSHQIMIFVYVCSTWGIVELQTRFETCITRNDVNGVSLYSPSLFINTNGLPVLRIHTKSPNQVLCYWLVLNRDWKRDSLQIIIFLYVYLTWTIVELETRFEWFISRNDVNGLRLYNLSIFITFLA